MLFNVLVQVCYNIDSERDADNSSIKLMKAVAMA